VQSELTPLVDDVISLSQHLCAAAGIPFVAQDVANNLRASLAPGNNVVTINHKTMMKYTYVIIQIVLFGDGYIRLLI